MNWNSYYCTNCGQWISGTVGHTCPGRSYWPLPPPHPFQPLTPFNKGQKCDICGSTAIDHTEAQCSMNRQFQNFSNVKPKSKKPN